MFHFPEKLIADFQKLFFHFTDVLLTIFFYSRHIKDRSNLSPIIANEKLVYLVFNFALQNVLTEANRCKTDST